MARRTTRSQADEHPAPAGENPAPARARTRRATANEVAAPQRSAVASGEFSEQDIRIRAYLRYVERGFQHGSDVDDWLWAEERLKSGR